MAHIARRLVRGSIGLLATALGITGVLPAAPAAAYPLNRCAPTENGVPVLDRVNVTQRVDVRTRSARVRIIAKAHDTGGPGVRTGLRAVQVGVSGLGAVDLAYVGNYWWEGFATMPRWTSDGTHVLESATLTDRAVFPWRYDYDPESEPVIDVMYRPRSDHRWSQVAGDRTFRVLSRPDATAPRVSRLTFAPAAVDTRTAPAVVTVTARATDDRSGVRDLRFTFDSAPGAPFDPQGGPRATLTPVPGTNGLLRGRVTIAREVGTRDWTVRDAVVRDRAGNVRHLDYQRFVDDGSPAVLKVVSDPPPPVGEATIASVTADVTEVDVHDGDRSVTYRVRAVNPVAPVDPDHVLTLDIPNARYQSIRISEPELVSGDLHDGIWKIVATVDGCAAVAGTAQPVVGPGDAAQGPGEVQAPPLRVLAPDNTTPAATVAWSRQAPWRILVDFSEDVNGITPGSLPVLRRVGLDRVPVAGTWTCGSEPGTGTDLPAAAVDCATGPVRRATYVLAEPVDRPFSDWYVWANPDHHLDLTDRAGNPAHRLYVIDWTGGAQ